MGANDANVTAMIAHARAGSVSRMMGPGVISDDIDFMVRARLQPMRPQRRWKVRRSVPLDNIKPS